MIWMHTDAARIKYGSLAGIIAAMRSGELSVDNGLPPSGEYPQASASTRERIEARKAMFPIPEHMKDKLPS